MEAGAQSAAEPLVELRLQRVVPRLRRVRAQPDDAARRILPLRAEWQPRVAVDRLEQVVAERAHVPDAQREVGSDLPLPLEAELVVAPARGSPRPPRSGSGEFGSTPGGTPAGVDCSRLNAFARLLRLIAATYGNELAMFSAMFRNAKSCVRAYPPRSTKRSPPVSRPSGPSVLVVGCQLKPRRGWKLSLSVPGTGVEREHLVVVVHLQDVLIQIDQALDVIARQARSARRDSASGSGRRASRPARSSTGPTSGSS